MKNESYEFIDHEHLPDIERMRESSSGVKDPGPWIIDPLYGVMMNKNCEPIEFFTDHGQPTANFEFISVCNPRSVAYLLNQRDTYRELCVEMLEALKYHRQLTRPIHQSDSAITKAEKLLGEKNGN